jgi:hypothetical protein
VKRIKLGRKDILEDHVLRAAMGSGHIGLRTRSTIEFGTMKNQHDESVCKISLCLNTKKCSS